MALIDMVYHRCGASTLIFAIYAPLELEEGITLLT